jgi:hypothetical protein
MKTASREVCPSFNDGDYEPDNLDGFTPEQLAERRREIINAGIELRIKLGRAVACANPGIGKYEH